MTPGQQVRSPGVHRPDMALPASPARPLVPLALLAALLPGQETPQDDRPILSLSTTMPALAWQVSRMLPGEMPGEPDSGEGDPLHLVVTAGYIKRMTSSKRADDTPILAIRAVPGALKDAFKKEAGLLGGFLRGYVFSIFTIGLRAEPRYVARAMKGVTDFPFQLDSLGLTVAPRKDGYQGLLIDLELLPRKGTWLHEVLAGVRASARGAHLLRTPDAALSVAAAVEGPAMQRMMEPFAEILAALRGGSKAERAEFRALVAERLPMYDGSFSMLIDGPGRYVRLIGLQRPAPYMKSIADPLGVRFDCRRVGRPDIEIAADKPDALRATPLSVMLRESDLAEAVTENPDSELTTYAGVVRDFSVKARLPKDGTEAARLVERIDRRRLRRLPLVDGALVVAEVHLPATRLRNRPQTEELVDALGPLFNGQGIEQALARIPEHVGLRVEKVRRQGRDALRLRIVSREAEAKRPLGGRSGR